MSNLIPQRGLHSHSLSFSSLFAEHRLIHKEMASQLGLFESLFPASGAMAELPGALCGLSGALCGLPGALCVLSDWEVPVGNKLALLNHILYLCLSFAVNTVFLLDFRWMSSTVHKREFPMSGLSLMATILRCALWVCMPQEQPFSLPMSLSPYRLCNVIFSPTDLCLLAQGFAFMCMYL